ncbi:MAG: hypothetical protein AXW15_05780 [Neptuniibacter sp. Phe_28]|nr:MAG: hypothetical protein AXW15_05780 [Neptuniibacter sp. Phe_28]
MTPSYRLEVNGKNITPDISGRLINLTLTDERRDKADQLEITLDDTDSLLEIPPQGAKIRLWLGFGDSLIFKGVFTVDETEHSGPPDQLTIRARSASFKGTLNQKREQSWHFITLGDMLRTMATRNGLTPVIHPSLDDYFIGHLDQTNESDLNFISRLATLHDAVSNVKADTLIFSPAGNKTTASGTLLSHATISRSNGDQHTYSETDKTTDYTGVQANWNNTNTGEQLQETAGSDTKLKVIRHTYATQKEAQTAAQAEWRKIQRAGKRLVLDLATAQPELYPEMPVTATGYKQQIDSLGWIIERVEHHLNDNGYKMRLEMESG